MATQKKIEFVSVVDAEGHPIPGFEHPVPSSWLGTDLLPAGTEKAPEVETVESDADAKVAELEAQVADLTKQLEATKAPDKPQAQTSK